MVGQFVTFLPQRLEFIELIAGIPLILAAFGVIIWKRGFTHEDRILFRMGKQAGGEATLPPPQGASPPVR